MFVRFLNYIALDIESKETVSEFSDTDSISVWAKEEVDTLRETGLIVGDDIGRFNPKDGDVRAEVAAVILRIADSMDNQLNIGGFLAEDGTEYTYSYVDSVSKEAFKSWLKSMTDAANLFDSMEIVGEFNFSGTEDTRAQFASGDETFEKMYKVTFSRGDSNSAERVRIYMASDGDDAVDGTKEAPIATIEKAPPINVYFREGDYYFAENVNFESQDSGTEEYPITYAAYPGETVTFCGRS